jgi:PKD repeat protein
MKRLIIVLALSAFGFSSGAQNNLKYCGSDEAQAEVFRNNPELYKEHLQREAENAKRDLEESKRGYKKVDAKGNLAVDTVIRYIPIVFHVIHNYGAENISDAQVRDAVRILNEDFMKRNADTSSIVSAFKGIADTAFIQFVLANVDPSGNCTNGIDRVVSTRTYSGDNEAKYNPWPYSQYLNVWTVASIASGAAGYAYKPGTAPNSSHGSADGIEILADYVGSIGTGNYGTARALSHEVGHWLGLSHTWGNTNSPGVACGVSDGISDTPETKGWTTCNLVSNDVCNPGTDENVQNIMEYAYCQRMFTTGQVALMRNSLLSSVGNRNNLWTGSNKSTTGTDIYPPDTCAPYSDFKANYKMLCAGSATNFSDLSWNATVTGWNWTFPGGTPSSSTSSAPTVTYSTPGTYDVTLEAFSSAGSRSTTKTGYIIVSSTTAALNAPYSEGFETAGAITAYTPDTWVVKSGDNIVWARSTAAAKTGTGSIRLSNYSAVAGDVDDAISNTYNMTTVTSPTLNFDVAYAQKLSTDADKLRVLVSVDCGRTWVQRYSKSGATLNTIGTTKSTNFTPTASQWRTETVGISAYATATNVRFKFEFTGDGGNNIFIDNINIGGVVGVNFIDPNAGLNLSVYPNPLEDNSMISFNLAQKGKVKLSLIDVLGRTVSNISNEDYAAGDHQLKLNHASLKPGVYFVSLKVDDKQTVFQKVLVQ